jgi:hypothetical protein
MNEFLEPAALTDALLVTKGAATPRRLRRARSGGGSIRAKAGDGRTRLSLRVDDERLRRIRLAAAHLGGNGQSLLIAALDHYLDRVMPVLINGPCPCLERGAAVAAEPCADKSCIAVMPLRSP